VECGTGTTIAAFHNEPTSRFQLFLVCMMVKKDDQNSSKIINLRQCEQYMAC